jgi:hypothetical protein
MRPRPIFDTLLTTLVLLIVWTLLRDGEWLTDENLAKVQPDQSLKSVIALLGPPRNNDYRGMIMMNDKPGPNGFYAYFQFEFPPSDDWSPTIIASIRPDHRLDLMWRNVGRYQSYFWFGKRRALWIMTSNAGTIVHVGVLDLERQGGGLWGWLTKQWHKWRP